MVLDTACERLEEMLAELDRSIAAVQEEHPEAEHHTADAGASLSDADRVDAALVRAREGTYGKCVECGVQVPEGRLDARPEASRCVTCQAKHDRRRR